MSWLNLNDSFSNIKDQFTNFAGGVINDIIEEKDDTASNNPDQSKFEQYHDGNPPPSTSSAEYESKVISSLKQEIFSLENDKKELLSSLEQLDSDNQQTVDNIVKFKDNLQTELNRTKSEYSILKHQFDNLKENEVGNLRKIKNLSSEKEKPEKEIQSIDEDIKKYKELQKSNEQLQGELNLLKDKCKSTDELENNNRKLQDTIDKLRSNHASLLNENQNVLLELTISDKQVSALKDEKKELYDDVQIKLKSVQDEYNQYKIDQKNMITQEDYSKLECILEEYERRVSNYEEEIKLLKTSNDTLKTDEAESESLQNIVESSNKIIESKNVEISSLKEMLDKLNEEMRVYEETHELESLECKDVIRNLNSKIVELNGTTEDLKARYMKLTTEYETLLNESLILSDIEKSSTSLKEEVSKLKCKNEKINNEIVKINEYYVEVLKREFNDYFEDDKAVMVLNNFADIQVNVTEFNNSLSKVKEVISSYKSEIKRLEDEICELNSKNEEVMTEKVDQIEKLTEDCSILGEDNAAKTQSLKHYEEECADINRNNELLLAELDGYKNNGLQSISESHEDNMFLLETLLEGANTKIKDLLNEIESLKSNKKQNELDLKEDQQNQIDVNEIKKANASLTLANEQLEHDLQLTKHSLQEFQTEKNNLHSVLEKTKSDHENIEYKYNEQIMNIDSMREEVEAKASTISDLNYQNKILTQANLEYESKQDILSNALMELNAEIASVVEDKEKFVLENRVLTEKLQKAKMSETSLKLQNDTLSKECNDVKANADTKYRTASVELKNLQAKCTKLEESIREFQEEIVVNTSKYDELECENKKLQEQLKEIELLKSSEVIEENKPITEELAVTENIAVISSEEVVSTDEVTVKTVEVNIPELQEKLVSLESQVSLLTNNRNELYAAVNSKHEESLKYYEEIQRLSEYLNSETEKCRNYELQIQDLNTRIDNNEEVTKKCEELDKVSDQNAFLREKCEILAQNLLQEQSNTNTKLSAAGEREQSLSRELERLRKHLLEVEEMYTKELVNADQKTGEMQTKVNEIEQREKNSSNIYTSVSIRANQQVETLQNQLQLVTHQRDELRNKVSDHEDQINKQTAALTNLQLVLEQFQKEKQKDVHNETERIRRQIIVEKSIHEQLQAEITNLKQQLNESKQGLQAAARLTDQLEQSKTQIITLNEEKSKLQAKLSETDKKYGELLHQPDSKVDKQLIKNLIIGFISSNNNLSKDQSQILKIISTVLEFTKQDNDKLLQTNKSSSQGSWMNSLLHPAQHGGVDQNLSQESLSLAFVKFLESESTPMVLPSLLDNNGVASSTDPKVPTVTAGNSRKQSTVSAPVILNEMVLPSFNDFGQSRNSSSILKDVLKDNN